MVTMNPVMTSTFPQPATICLIISTNSSWRNSKFKEIGDTNIVCIPLLPLIKTFESYKFLNFFTTASYLLVNDALYQQTWIKFWQLAFSEKTRCLNLETFFINSTHRGLRTSKVKRTDSN